MTERLCHVSSGVSGHPVRVWSVTLILTFPSYPALPALPTLGGLIINVITGNEDVTTLLKLDLLTHLSSQVQLEESVLYTAIGHFTAEY